MVEELELQVETRLFNEFGMHEAASMCSCLSVSHVDPVAVRTNFRLTVQSDRTRVHRDSSVTALGRAGRPLGKADARRRRARDSRGRLGTQ